MDPFAVTESRTLFFHRVLLEQIERSPALLERARAALPDLAPRAPQAVRDRWQALLSGPVTAMAAAILDEGPDGGMLRAHSPLLAAMSDAERNSLWQRVGMQQIVAYGLAAAADLGLSPEEEAAVLGEAAAQWHQAPPATLTVEAMDPLKQIIAIQRALAVLVPDGHDRQAWLRTPHPAFGARPVEILTNGGAALLQQGLAEMVRPHLDRRDLPAH
jgi:hypothetical protein